MSAGRGNEGCGEMAGWRDWRERMEQGGRDGPCLIKRSEACPPVRAFSYRLVMPCHHHCSQLVRESISSVSGTVLPAKPPERLQTSLSPLHPLCPSLRKRPRWQLPRKKWLRVRGFKERSWKMRMCGAVSTPSQPLSFFFFPLSGTHTIPLARLFPSPNLFSLARHSLCRKIRLSLQLGIKAPSSAWPSYEKSHSWAFDWSAGTCLCRPGSRKTLPLMQFVREKTRLAFYLAPPLCSM